MIIQITANIYVEIYLDSSYDVTMGFWVTNTFKTYSANVIHLFMSSTYNAWTQLPFLVYSSTYILYIVDQ